uniref:Hm1 protein n=1 Tax=Schistosoma japonicum TaxID=6182 RepID=Q8MTB6_SCHJA|nr:Hm1 protein [Schistosoma japonicum]
MTGINNGVHKVLKKEYGLKYMVLIRCARHSAACSFVVLNILRVFFTHFLSFPQSYSSLLQRPSQLHAHCQLCKLGDNVI